ncbi:hypothetical protein HRM2_39410 [Desulforapulum autotrophicum HRM2]|uniref:Uncharacterized protein n=1 Tax=Desulforapulum autotrophicum (strain ATCC 43914 / DSM 3382 / VKM B-1955 / HRM2) TaxID=177437 RepID=C0QBJ7_DESAH|nr:hypothetical protein HRM2_39410 [Desulforapulum autotrophicum HRM2]
MGITHTIADAKILKKRVPDLLRMHRLPLSWFKFGSGRKRFQGTSAITYHIILHWPKL